MMAKIRPAKFPEEIPILRQIILEYHQDVDIDLTFQNFEDEIASLPGRYSPPKGGVIFSFDDDEVTGCVAFRPFRGNICEMKRLFVRPKHRGSGLGRLLTEKILEEARNAGYKTMYLDTLTKLNSSLAMYRSLGFVEIPPYYFNPLPGAVYFSVELTDCRV